jgi:hypothetical protein
MVLGTAALAPDIPAQAAAFIAGRHLSYYRPGMYVRHLVASGTGLKAWLFAALKLIAPQFPVAKELEGPVKEALGGLEAAITGKSKDHLARIVAKLLQTGALDLKKWLGGVDLTADRMALVVAHDLNTAVDVIKGSEEAASSVPADQRQAELVLYSVSKNFFELRQKLGIAIGG